MKIYHKMTHDLDKIMLPQHIWIRWSLCPHNNEDDSVQLNNLSLHNEEGVLHPEREILKDGGHTNAQSNLPLFKYRRKSGLFVWRCNIPLNFKCSQRQVVTVGLFQTVLKGIFQDLFPVLVFSASERRLLPGRIIKPAGWIKGMWGETEI